MSCFRVSGDSGYATDYNSERYFLSFSLNLFFFSLKDLLILQLEMMTLLGFVPSHQLRICFVSSVPSLLFFLVVHLLCPQPVTHFATSLHGFLSCIIQVFAHRHSLREVFLPQVFPLASSPCHVVSIYPAFWFSLWHLLH